ncbi:DEAD/DEAH box helicase [Bowdeniella massiliensis]|uniref:DEAD/DEAH box helicase n=1 Tax=Bowdeniella massiliensis TaxID=2932264 RepID=UPI002027882E|nr:DEAD/DEAH box helicase [Bowdeniella massiliensis]
MSALNPALNVVLDDLEDAGLSADPDAIASAFADWAERSGRPLYDHQAEATLAIVSGAHTIAATPTGSGKSMIALAAHLNSLAAGGRTYYTAPLKALVSEKFFDLIHLFGSANVGMITGDAAVNPGAPIICCTAEILAMQALREGENLDVHSVVMDEFHFYSDPQRGWAWQVPLLEIPHAQFILMSATLGDTAFFERDLTDRTGREVITVTSATRPVPLNFSYSIEPIHELLDELVHTHRAPVYVVHFSQRDAVERASALLSVTLIDKDRQAKIAAALGDFRFGPGFGQTLSKLVRRGIGVHHAGMLPRYRRLVERLAQSGLLAVVCGTDTLGVGINVPIRTVVLTKLTKFDGVRERHLSAREFHQIAGRAGRAGFDTMGDVVVQAPEHVIENAAALKKADGDPKKVKKITRKKAPVGVVNWTESTFERLVAADPEPLTSHMEVTHALVLSVLARPGDPVAHLYHLLSATHEQVGESNHLLREAVHVIRSLRQAGVIEHVSSEQARREGTPRLRLTADLPEDFALNQPLSPFALAAIELLEPESETYPLDVVSVIEAVCESPMPLLYAQRNAARGEAIAAMKAEGLDYDERMALLEEVTWPEPLKDLLEPAFATYSRTNPWVLGRELQPKSVVREMIENAMTFSDLISRYDVGRSEGVVLRYLTDVYRSLRQILPEAARTEAMAGIIEWLAALIRAVDSSLLDEWEQLADPDTDRRVDPDATDGAERAFGADESGRVAFSANPHALRTAIRSELMDVLQLLDRERYDELAERFTARDFSADDWADAIDPYFEEYEWIGTGPQARGSSYLTFAPDPDAADLHLLGFDESYADTERLLAVTQILQDPHDDHAWSLRVLVDLAASDEQRRPVLLAGRVAEVGA